MSDPAFSWLLQQLQQRQPAPALWCLDENATPEWQSLRAQSELSVVSNRWDIAQAMGQQGWNAQFCDLDLNHIADNSLAQVYYRISKEKPVVHQLFNQAWRCLQPGGRLYIAGQKNEGIKTYIDKMAKLLGCSKTSQKLGMAYVAVLEKHNAFAAELALDTSDYEQLRPIYSDSQGQILSKPGQFGWNKLDQGSAFLIEHLVLALQTQGVQPTSCLDLGCGYGYLSLMASRLPACQTIAQWFLTDNNAAALLSARENTLAWGLNAQVLGDDCAAHIQVPVDVILCNPPFHQGFSVEGELTERFVAAARRLLKNNGLALFVVNQFIPLEKKAAGLFRHVQTLANNGSFKLVLLRP